MVSVVVMGLHPEAGCLGSNPSSLTHQQCFLVCEMQRVILYRVSVSVKRDDICKMLGIYWWGGVSKMGTIIILQLEKLRKLFRPSVPCPRLRPGARTSQRLCFRISQGFHVCLCHFMTIVKLQQLTRIKVIGSDA